MAQANDELSALIAARFENLEAAERAVSELREVAFPATDIRMIFRSDADVTPFDTGVNPGLDPEMAYDPTTYPPAPETTLTGASPFTKSEEELSWEKEQTESASATEPGASSSSVSELKDFGMSSEAAQQMAGLLTPGSALLIARASSDRAPEARTILVRNGGVLHLSGPKT